MKLAQAMIDGRRSVGQVLDDTFLPWAGPADDPDRAILSLAMDGWGDRPRGEPVPLAGVRLLAPVSRPPSIRDFLIFPEHLTNASGRSLPEGWYDRPGFYFTNPHVVFGPGEVVTNPGVRRLDFELEVGIVVGRDLVDADPDSAVAAIAGFTIFNDFSARDVQIQEAPLGLGPSKGKDFAHGLGPVLVTPDEFAGTARRPHAEMTARVNGVELSRGRLETMHFDLGEVLAHASRNSRVAAGDVIGTGTVPTGCLAEYRMKHGRDAHSWLQAGDVVELEVEHIGVLTNVVGPE
jgi:2-keto-4-pentenoate hydratase/2-oxohepta-3-ene-1,7-dioic acid hydratase in catechol pathway